MQLLVVLVVTTELLYVINFFQSSSLEKVSFYKVTTAFAKDLQLDSSNLATTSLSGTILKVY